MIVNKGDILFLKIKADKAVKKYKAVITAPTEILDHKNSSTPTDSEYFTIKYLKRLCAISIITQIK